MYKATFDLKTPHWVKNTVTTRSFAGMKIFVQKVITENFMNIISLVRITEHFPKFSKSFLATFWIDFDRNCLYLILY